MAISSLISLPSTFWGAYSLQKRDKTKHKYCGNNSRSQPGIWRRLSHLLKGFPSSTRHFRHVMKCCQNKRSTNNTQEALIIKPACFTIDLTPRLFILSTISDAIGSWHSTIYKISCHDSPRILTTSTSHQNKGSKCMETFLLVCCTTAIHPHWYITLNLPVS